jgi:hypothetical protein
MQMYFCVLRGDHAVSVWNTQDKTCERDDKGNQLGLKPKRYRLCEKGTTYVIV